VSDCRRHQLTYALVMLLWSRYLQKTARELGHTVPTHSSSRQRSESTGRACATACVRLWADATLRSERLSRPHSRYQSNTSTKTRPTRCAFARLTIPGMTRWMGSSASRHDRPNDYILPPVFDHAPVACSPLHIGILDRHRWNRPLRQRKSYFEPSSLRPRSSGDADEGCEERQRKLARRDGV